MVLGHHIFFSLILLSIHCEDISNTKTVFDYISKHLKVRKNTPLPVLFSSLFISSRCLEMRSNKVVRV